MEKIAFFIAIAMMIVGLNLLTNNLVASILLAVAVGVMAAIAYNFLDRIAKK